MAATETKSTAAGEPLFRRPTREDALTLARNQFLEGERVEMQTLSVQLDISRTTLYRWVGEREQLMGEICTLLLEDWIVEVLPAVEGEGHDWFLDLLRRFLEFAAASGPLTEFTQREPALALRVLTDREGPLTARADEVIETMLADAAPEIEVPTEIANAIGLVARTLVWANIASGQAPDIDGAVDLARTLLRTTTAPSG